MFLNEMNGLCEMKEMFEMTKKITMYHTDVINAIKNYKG